MCFLKNSLHQDRLCLYNEIPSADVQRRHVHNEHAKKKGISVFAHDRVRFTSTRYQIPKCFHGGSHIFTMFFSSRKVVGAVAHVQWHLRSPLKDL